MFLGEIDIDSRSGLRIARIGSGLAENMYDNVAVLVLKTKCKAFVHAVWAARGMWAPN